MPAYAINKLDIEKAAMTTPVSMAAAGKRAAPKVAAAQNGSRDKHNRTNNISVYADIVCLEMTSLDSEMDFNCFPKRSFSGIK